VDEKEAVLSGVIVVIVLAATAETVSEAIAVIDLVETAVIALETEEEEEDSRRREALPENLPPLSEEKVVVVVVVVDSIAIVLVTDPVLEVIGEEIDLALVGVAEITEDPKDLRDSDGVVLALLLVNKHSLLIFSLLIFSHQLSKILEAVQFSSLLSLRVSHSGPELYFGTNVTNEYY